MIVTIIYLTPSNHHGWFKIELTISIRKWGISTLEKPKGKIKNGQSRETGNIRYTRHTTKANKAENTTQKTKKMSNSKILDITVRKHTQTHNKTWDLLQTIWDKDEPSIVYMRKWQQTSQHGTQNVKTHTMTAHTNKQKQKQTIKEQKTRTSQKTRGWTHVLAKGKQFLLLIRYPPCYTYIQSNPVKLLAVIKERKHIRKK